MKIKMVEVKKGNTGFLIGKYPVTQKEWKEVMGDNPSRFKGDNHPVENVSWYDAIDFCNRLSIKEGLTPAYKIKDSTDPDEWGEYFDDKASFEATPDWEANGYRLPIETEWEHAAKGGNKSKGYRFSGSHDVDIVAWYSKNADKKTHPVGYNVLNELGLYDMSGNVWEWCWDAWRENGVKDCRVLRGGSWIDVANHCTVSYRDFLFSTGTSGVVGFRLCRNIQNDKDVSENKRLENNPFSNAASVEVESKGVIDRKVYNIDIDDTLKTSTRIYREPRVSMSSIVNKVREIYNQGHIVIMSSGRQWADAGKVVGWLETNEIPYHGLMMGKGSADYYIDDKTMSARDFLQIKN